MRRTVVLLASMTLAVVLLFSVIPYGEPAAAQASREKPNFVYIIADDMRYDDLGYMPKVRNLLGSHGLTFENAYVPFGRCCPSRVSVLTGMYTHNHKVWSNHNGPQGGWEGFRRQGHEHDNMATRMHAAGYRTGLFGKYLNGYDGSRAPPGWSDWFGTHKGRYFDWYANDNGENRHYGTARSDYETDVLNTQTLQFINQSVNDGKPFMAYVSPTAPKGPSIPAPRHTDAFNGEKAPRLPSFNEADVSDKPPWIQALPSLSPHQIAAIDEHHERRVETLQALDDLVQDVVNELDAKGVLSNTYVIFTSDNGDHHGEHRIAASKGRPYEESIHMPLLIRGPEVTRTGSTTNRVALNIDIFPTFADLGGVDMPSYVDGRSLRPVLEATDATWRTAFLLEGEGSRRKSFFGVRTTEPRKYVEYEEDGVRELYDLPRDPYELKNLYNATTPPLDLAARLEALKRCPDATTSCRQAEDGP